MTKIPNNKPIYDLEERTFQFAKNQNSSGHSYLEFEICLVFDACNLGFRGFPARVQHV